MSCLHATVERAVNHGSLSPPPTPPSLPHVTYAWVDFPQVWILTHCTLVTRRFCPSVVRRFSLNIITSAFSNKFSCPITLKFIRCTFDWDVWAEIQDWHGKWGISICSYLLSPPRLWSFVDSLKSEGFYFFIHLASSNHQWTLNTIEWWG